MICQVLIISNHLVVNALLFFSSYLLPPTLQAHHLPSVSQLGTKPPCRCGSNVLGRPPRSPHCRCIWWRWAHSWGSPSQHLHPDLRHPGQMGRKWGWTDELKKNHYEALWSTGFIEVALIFNRTWSLIGTSRTSNLTCDQIRGPNSWRRGQRNQNAGAPAGQRKLRKEAAPQGGVFQCFETWVPTCSNKVSLDMIGPTKNEKVSVRPWLF